MASEANADENKWIFQKLGCVACKNAINFNNDSVVSCEGHKIALFHFIVKAGAQASCQYHFVEACWLNRPHASYL